MAKPLKALGAYLDKGGITQMTFAQRVGVSQSVVSDIIHGKHSPSLDLLVRIAKETGLSLDKLVASKAA